MVTFRDNYVTLFLLPLLKLNNAWLQKRIKGHRRLINGYMYLDNEDTEHFKQDHISMIIQTYQSEDFSEEENKLLVHPDLVSYYDICHTKYSVFVFNMSRYDDYYKFLEGKYSEFSNWAKQLIIEKSIGEMDDVVLAKAILEKSETLKPLVSEKYGVEIDVLKDCELGPIWSSATEKNILTQELFNKLDKSGKVNLNHRHTT